VQSGFLSVDNAVDGSSFDDVETAKKVLLERMITVEAVKKKCGLLVGVDGC
jgi:hypothetical protein